MPLTRKTSWATRELHDFLRQRADQPFAWGSNDCCLFPADAILAMTGVDIAAEFRGTYSDCAGAMYAIACIAGGYGVGHAAAYCAEQAGLAELASPLCAQRGDLVVLENNTRDVAGLVALNGRELVTVGEGGLVTFPITHAKRAWRV